MKTEQDGHGWLPMFPPSNSIPDETKMSGMNWNAVDRTAEKTLKCKSVDFSVALPQDVWKLIVAGLPFVGIALPVLP